MDYPRLLRKRNVYQEGKTFIPELTAASYERAFEIEYTHHSTAIEGNTLTLIETKLVLEEGNLAPFAEMVAQLEEARLDRYLEMIEKV